MSRPSPRAWKRPELRLQRLQRPTSVPARVEAALRQAGKPMTTSALATATGASVSSVASAVSHSLRRKGEQSPFVRVRNGVFALREWRKTE